MGLKNRATKLPQLFKGLNGNYYVVSTSYVSVKSVADAIGRRSGVYFRKDLGVWALRVRADRHKKALEVFFGKGQICIDLDKGGAVVR